MSPRNIIAFINSVRLSDGILPCSTKYQPLPPFTSSSWSFPLYFAGKNMGQSQLRHAQNVPRRNPQQAPSNPTLPLRLALPYDGPLPPPSLPSALSTSSIPVISHTMHRGHTLMTTLEGQPERRWVGRLLWDPSAVCVCCGQGVGRSGGGCEAVPFD